MNTLQESISPAASRSFGTNGPQAPVTGPELTDRARRFDPSSGRPAGSYPIPSFFDYRANATVREIL